MDIEKMKIKSNQDGLDLDLAIKEPQGEVKAIVQISHGMAEHKERYYPFMEYLAQCGYISVINDHRGHGKSVQNKEDLGYFKEDNAEYIVEDLHQITLFIKEKYPNKKLILFGHSMGSMVVRKYIKKYDKQIDKLIVCGSPSKNKSLNLGLLTTKIIKRFKGEHYRSKLMQNLAFGSYNKNIKNPISKNSWICSDMEVVKKYDEDELCGFIFTTNGFQNLFILMKDCYSKKGWDLNNKELKIFFIAGEEDPVISSKKEWKKAQDFLKEIGYNNISNKLYQGMRHEILNEKENKKVYKDIIKWIEKD